MRAIRQTKAVIRQMRMGTFRAFANEDAFRVHVAQRLNVDVIDLTRTQTKELRRAWRQAQKALSVLTEDIAAQLSPEERAKGQEVVLKASDLPHIQGHMANIITAMRTGDAEDLNEALSRASKETKQAVDALLGSLSEDQYRHVMATSEIEGAQNDAFNEASRYLAFDTRGIETRNMPHVTVPRDRAVRLMQLFAEKGIEYRLPPERVTELESAFRWVWQRKNRDVREVVGRSNNLDASNVLEYIDEHGPMRGTALEVPSALWQQLTEAEKNAVLGPASYTINGRYQRKSVREQSFEALNAEQLARLMSLASEVKKAKSPDALIDSLSFLDAETVMYARFSSAQGASETALANIKLANNSLTEGFYVTDHLMKGGAVGASMAAGGFGLTAIYVAALSTISGGAIYNGLRNARIRAAERLRGMLKFYRVRDKMMKEVVSALTHSKEGNLSLIDQLNDEHALKIAYVAWAAEHVDADLQQRFQKLIQLLRTHYDALNADNDAEQFMRDILNAYDSRPARDVDRAASQRPVQQFMNNLISGLNAAGLMGLVTVFFLPLLGIPVAGWIVGVAIMTALVVTMAVRYVWSRRAAIQSKIADRRAARIGVRQGAFAKVRALLKRRRMATARAEAAVSDEEVELELARSEAQDARSHLLIRNDGATPELTYFLNSVRMSVYREYAGDPAGFRAYVMERGEFKHAFSAAESAYIDAALKEAQPYFTSLENDIFPHLDVESRTVGGRMLTARELQSIRQYLEAKAAGQTDFHPLAEVLVNVQALMNSISEDDYRHVFMTDEAQTATANAYELGGARFVDVPRERAVRLMQLLAQKGVYYQLDDAEMEALSRRSSFNARELSTVIEADGRMTADNVIEFINDHAPRRNRGKSLAVPENLLLQANLSDEELAWVFGPAGFERDFMNRRRDLRNRNAVLTQAQVERFMAAAARTPLALSNDQLVNGLSLREARHLYAASHTWAQGAVAGADPFLKIGANALSPITYLLGPVVRASLAASAVGVGGFIALTPVFVAGAVVFAGVIPALLIGFMIAKLIINGVNARRNARARQLLLAKGMFLMKSEKIKTAPKLEELVLALAAHHALRTAFEAWKRQHFNAAADEKYDAIMKLIRKYRHTLNKAGSIDRLLLEARVLHDARPSASVDVKRGQSQYKMFMGSLAVALVPPGLAATLLMFTLPAFAIPVAGWIVALVVGVALLGTLAIQYAIKRRADKQAKRSQRSIEEFTNRANNAAAVSRLVTEQADQALEMRNKAAERAAVRAQEVDAAKMLHDATDDLYNLLFNARDQSRGNTVVLQPAVAEKWQAVRQARARFLKAQTQQYSPNEDVVLKEAEAQIMACCVQVSGVKHRHHDDSMLEQAALHEAHASEDDVYQSTVHVPKEVTVSQLDSMLGVFGETRRRAKALERQVSPKHGRDLPGPDEAAAEQAEQPHHRPGD